MVCRANIGGVVGPPDPGSSELVGELVLPPPSHAVIASVRNNIVDVLVAYTMRAFGSDLEQTNTLLLSPMENPELAASLIEKCLAASTYENQGPVSQR